MSARKPGPIVNLADVALMDFGNGDGFVAKIARIGPTVGAQQLGCSLTALRPGDGDPSL